MSHASTAAKNSDAKGHDDAHGDVHAHDSSLAHHFDTHQQQFDSAKVGMWIFLATEILMFGGLFVAYAVWRANHPEVFLYAHTKLHWEFGAINTVLLIGSSFTMACAVRAAQLNQRKLLVALLLMTIGGGCGFLVVKTFEYSEKYKHALWVGHANQFHPLYKGEVHSHDEHAAAGGHAAEGEHGGAGVSPTGMEHQGSGRDARSTATSSSSSSSSSSLPLPDRSNIAPPAAGPTGTNAKFLTPSPALSPLDAAMPPSMRPGATPIPHHSLQWDQLPDYAKAHTHQFFQIYFLMTGLHTFHVIVGICLIAWITIRGAKGQFSEKYFTPVDLVGLYWHLVDLIWIFLFPLLYLIH